MKGNTRKVGTAKIIVAGLNICSGTAILPFKALVKPSHTSTVAKPAGTISRQSLKQDAKYFKIQQVGYMFLT